MSRKKSIAQNAVLNAVKTALSIIFPLITYPYVARVLHAANLGKVTYSQSIVSYFALIAALGINTYAVREGVKLKDNKEKLEYFCSEVYTTNIVTSMVAYFLLFVCVFSIGRFQEYALLIALLSASIAMSTVGVEWVNVIYEDYWLTTIRSIIVQILNIFLLFMFVRAENDYYIYALLIVVSNGIIGVWNYIYVRRYIKLKIVLNRNFFKHLKASSIFFASNLAISVYCYSDTTMLGLISGDKFVGEYSVAVKAYTVVKTILASVYMVCIPRLSHYWGTNNKVDYKRLVNDVLCGLILISLPVMAGVFALSEPIIMVLGGSEYISAVSTLRIFSLALLFAIIGGVFSNCINIPSGKERVTLKATVLAATLNIILNLVFIPLWGHVGAAITTVVAEVAVVIVCFLGNKDICKLIDWKLLGVNSLHALTGCGSVMLGIILAKHITSNDFLFCLTTFVATIITYILLLLLLRNKYFLLAIEVIRKRLHH